MFAVSGRGGGRELRAGGTAEVHGEAEAMRTWLYAGAVDGTAAERSMTGQG